MKVPVATISGFLIIAALLAGCGGSDVPPSNVATPTPEVSASPTADLASITDANAALAEGNRLLDENQTQAAISAFQRAVELNADLADAYFQLGIAYELLDLQNEQAGIVTATPAANSKGKPVKTNAERAYEKAVGAYEKRIDADGKDHAAYFSLGRTYVKLLEDEDAEKAFKQAVKLNPDDSEYQTELGSILIVLAQYAEAIGPLKKAIELDPGNARAQEMLEDATAGRQRIDYRSKNTNTIANKAVKSTSNTASNSNSNSAPAPANKAKEDPPKALPRPTNRP